MRTALLTIPLAQEGRDAALRMLLISALFGPAAAVSLYFANREAAIERRVAQAEGLAVEIAVQSLQE